MRTGAQWMTRRNSKITRRCKMRAVYILGLTVVSLILMLQIPVFSAAEVTPNEIIMVAQGGMKSFIQTISKENVGDFGFASYEEANSATLGEGFQIFTVSPDNLLNNIQGSQDLNSMAVPTTLWRFLIKTLDKAAAIITVDLVNNQWTPVSIGASGMAAQLNSFLGAWPASQGYQYRWIRVYQATADFIELFQKDQTIGFVPLNSGRIALGLNPEFDPQDIRSSKDILPLIEPLVRKNMQTVN
jgi:hypothetical protein